jgi:hypothetical protein
MHSELAESPRQFTCRGVLVVWWRCIHGAGSFDLFESQPIVSVSWKAKYHPRQILIDSMAPERRQARAQRACTYCRQRKVRPFHA